MEMLAVSVIKVLIFAVLPVSADGLLMEGPSQINVVLRASATFNCTARAHTLVWYIDGQLIDASYTSERNISYSVEIIHGGLLRSVLTIAAIPVNNETKVECEAHLFRDGNIVINRSEAVVLQIQGRLAAASELIVRHQSEDTIQLSWIPPFTLPGVPITNFLLNWSNLMTERNGTIVVMLSHVDTDSETGRLLCNFSTNNPSPCHIYEFQLIAVNDGGMGVGTESIQGNFLSGPIAIQQEEIAAEIEFTLSTLVNVTLLFPTENCQGRAADNYTVHMYSVQGPDGCTHQDLKGNTIHNDKEIEFMDTTETLPLNVHYRLIIEAKNSVGTSNSTESMQISTFDVQNVNIRERSPGFLKITCIFAKGSEADGCCVMLQDPELRHTTILKDSAGEAVDTISVRDSDVYVIHVYDLEKNETSCDFTNPAIWINQTSATTSMSAKIYVAAFISTGLVLAVILMCGCPTVYNYYRLKRHRSKAIHTDIAAGPVYEDVTLPYVKKSPVLKANPSYAVNIQTRRNVSYEDHRVQCHNSETDL